MGGIGPRQAFVLKHSTQNQDSAVTTVASIGSDVKGIAVDQTARAVFAPSV